MSPDDESLSDEIVTWLAESNILGWGALMLPDGPRVRVHIRERDGRRCACFLIPSGGLERMTPGDWPEWLGARGLAECTPSSVYSVHQYFDAPRRQHTWEVVIRLREGNVDEAACHLPVVPFHPFMAWRGPGLGDVVEFDDGPLSSLDPRPDADEGAAFDSRGHELFARMVHEVLRLVQGHEGWISFEVLAIEGEPFDIGVTRGRGELTVSPELRRLVAHFYEWTEHCQGVPWRSMYVEIYDEEGNSRYYLELDYHVPPPGDDDRE